MHVILATAPSRARRLAALAAATTAFIGLVGCDGPSHAPPPLHVTNTTQDVAGSWARGQDVTFTYTVVNSSSGTLSDLAFITGNGTNPVTGAPPFEYKSITCAAQGTTCPATAATSIATGTMPPGSTLTFTVTMTVAVDFDGQATQSLEVYSPTHSGDATAASRVTLTDARDGAYEIFSSSGRLASLAVHFLPGAMTFWVSSDNTAASFAADPGGYKFSDGSHMLALPDVLVGSYDFGAGPEPFVAARDMVTALADLDGASFTVFSSDSPAVGTAATAARAARIAGSTLAWCTDAQPHTVDTCPAALLWHYALTIDGSVITGTDSQHGDVLTFQVANSGDTRILLRAEKIGGVGRFAIGLPSAAAPTSTPLFYGTVAGQWSLVGLAPTNYQIAPFLGQVGFGQYGPAIAVQDVAGGPAGLRQGVRASDGATITVAGSDVLAVQLGAPGELDLLGLVTP